MLFNVLTKLFRLREQRPSEQRDEQGDIVKPFLDHMEDLRWVVFKVLAVLITGMIAGFWHRHELMHLLQHPLYIADPTGEMAASLRTDTPIASFMISFKLAFFAGIGGGLPFILYFIADFVLPALTRKEKRMLIPGFGVGVIFFAAGVLASYFYITPHTLDFFWKDTRDMELVPLWTWSSYISFCMWLTFGFGLMCEVPLVVLMLASFGIVNYKFLASTRNYAITIILVLAAIVAPTPDPITFLVLATPVVIMYECCIWIVWALEGRRRKREAAAAVDELVS